MSTNTIKITKKQAWEMTKKILKESSCDFADYLPQALKEIGFSKKDANDIDVNHVIKALKPDDVEDSEEEKEEENEEWEYYNSLGRPYNNKKNVNSIQFCISRYGKFFKGLKFTSLVSEKIAIRKVEEYLSKKATKEYYDKIACDCMYSFKENKPRGYYLGDCRYIERVTIKDGRMTFECGS
jgi:hypothetical protein